MKKLFFFLSIALVLMVTSCDKATNTVVFPVENDGEENVIYRYYSISQGLCGMQIQTVNKQLADLGYTQTSNPNEYRLVHTDYIVTFSFSDQNDDDTVDVMTVNLIPGDGNHTVVLDLKNIKDFVQTVGNNIKLFPTHTPCSYYGYYTATGTWLGTMYDVKDIVNDSRMTETEIDGGMALWLDSNIKTFNPADTAAEMFTGMYLNPVRDTRSTTEFDIEIGFVINQKL